MGISSPSVRSDIDEHGNRLIICPHWAPCENACIEPEGHAPWRRDLAVIASMALGKWGLAEFCPDDAEDESAYERVAESVDSKGRRVVEVRRRFNERWNFFEKPVMEMWLFQTPGEVWVVTRIEVSDESK